MVNDTAPAVPVDPLGEALHSLRMSGTLYCHCELSAPWSLIGNHVVSEGTDITNFHFDCVAGEHVAVGALGAHP